ncbi:hypothetical protein ACO2JO_15535 [Leptospira interrogans]
MAKAGRQRAAAQSSLTDRINLSVAEAFVNVGSLTRLNLYIHRRPRKFACGLFCLALDFLAEAIRKPPPGTIGWPRAMAFVKSVMA